MARPASNRQSQLSCVLRGGVAAARDTAPAVMVPADRNRRRQRQLLAGWNDVAPRQLALDGLFVADRPDPSPRDDVASMEFPLFALRPGDCAVRTYSHRGIAVQVIPSSLGAATQRDKDILLFCVSQLVDARNLQRTDLSRTVVATAYAILCFCGRGTSGTDYARLMEALNRLRGTTIRTDYVTGGKQITEGFGLIESYRLQRSSRHGGRIEAIEITLSEWLYNAVDALEVLAINPSYFKLHSDLERRLYELARKHCGAQPQWRIGIAKLLHKSGSRSGLREFRRKLKNIAAADTLPDYRLAVCPTTDSVVFAKRGRIDLANIVPRSQRGQNRVVDNSFAPVGNL